MMNNDDKKKQAYNAGVVILILLAVLTVGEFLIGSVASIWAMPLLAIALIKAYLIVRDYMHIGRVFARDEEQHS